MIINLPEVSVQAVINNGTMYLKKEDVAKWIFECAQEAQRNGLNDAAQFTMGIGQSLILIEDIKKK